MSPAATAAGSLPPGPTAGTALRTICVLGFPPEGVLPRELKNLCRFIPGFEGAHVAFNGGSPSTLFVKFLSAEAAQDAAIALHGAPWDTDNPAYALKVEYARREMDVRESPMKPAPPPAVRQPAALHPALVGGLVPAARGQRQVMQTLVPASRPAEHLRGHLPARMGSTGGALVTIVVFGLREKGLQQEDLLRWMKRRPGYLISQMNTRIDGMFVKFHTHRYAEQAMEAANAENIGAEWARRNLDDDKGAGGSAVQSAPSYQPVQQAPARRRVSNAGEELLTIAVLGLTGKDVDPSKMQEWFRECPGFDTQQLNERINGLFVKFYTGEDADSALSQANRFGWGAEWARRNLDDDLSARNAVPAPELNVGLLHSGGRPAGGAGLPPAKRARVSAGEIDTLSVLGIREREAQHGDLEGWFMALPGYLHHEVNERLDMIFVKFESREAAEQALGQAGAMDLAADWARRNLEL